MTQLRRTVDSMIGGLWGNEPEQGPDDVHVVRVADFDYQRLRVGAISTIRHVPRHLQSERLLRRGDLLIEKSGGGDRQNVGRVVMWTGDVAAISSNFITVLRPSAGFEARFLSYLHRALYVKGCAAACTKQTTGIQNLDLGAYLSSEVDVGPHFAQHAIADFLDRECAQIDELMREIRSLEQTQVEALQSLRERILIRCGPTVRLKYGLISCVDTAHATCPRVDGGPHLVIRTTGVRQGTLDIAGCYPTDDTSFAAWTCRRVPRPGDIVFTREAPVGEAAVIPSHGSWCLGQRSVLLVADRGRLDPDFLVLALYGRAVKEEIILRARSTTAAHLNVSEIGDLPIPMPSIERQIEAASEFAEARSRFSDLQKETSAVAATLVEYRDALITEVVSGELDITNVSESQMDESLAAVREGAQPEVPA